MIHIDDVNQTPVADSPEGTTETESQVVEQPQAETSTPETTETQAQDSESFFDPNTVPEELKQVYKGMQSAYTKKTQEIAEQRKEIEAYRQKAEQFDRYQQHIPMIEEMLSKQQTQRSPELEAMRQMLKADGYSDEAIDMMEKGIGFALSHINQSQASQRQQDWIQAKIEEAGSVDPRLNDQSLTYQTEDGETVTFGQMVEQLVESDSTWTKDPVAATKKAIKKLDALIGNAKKAGKEELSEQAKAKAQKFPSTQSSPQSASDTQSTGSIRDIGNEVMKEMGIKS